MSLRYSPAFVPILAVVALCAAACDSATTSSVTTGPTPAKCQLTLAQPSNIVAGGGSGTIAVTAQPECAWTVSSQPSWVSDVSPNSGQGNGNVEFRAAANTVPSMREGEIVVNDNRVRVMQEAAPCRFAIAPDNQNVNSSAGTASVAVSTLNGCTWTARSNAPWITITSGAQGNGNGSVALRIAASNGESRTGTVTIADLTHTITQADGAQPGPTPPTPPSPPTPPTPPTPPNCAFTIAPNNESIAAAGGAGTAIAVTASGGNCTWTATSNASWITVTSGATGSGNGSVGFSVAANTGAARNGSLTIAGQTFTANQAAAAAPVCTYTLDANSASPSALGGPGSVSVTAAAGCAWTATTSASWITLTAGASGNGNGTVSFLVLPNLGAARSDSILIAGQTFTINQAAVLPSCTYSLSPSGTTVPIAGGTGSFNVTATPGCAWTAVPGAPWIAITSGASGNGNGTVGFAVVANPGATRSGAIAVASESFSITQ
jgi:Putative binding domain, N-terminal/Viral BACON domain